MRPRVAVVLLLLSACAAPERLTHHRSPLLAVPVDPLTPEGRPNAVPFGGRARAGALPRLEGEAIAASAARLLGRRHVSANGKRFPDDCTGLVRAVYAEHGVDLLADGSRGAENGVTAIYRFADSRGEVHTGSPRPGDIVFFRETYDRNRDGRENDGLTHIGIVERVEESGTVHVIHRVDRGVVRYRMNVAHPGTRKDAKGRVLNDYLREGRRNRLAGELFAAYATLARR